jgi:tetratricopeptide (TPR) repeat protein
MSKPPVRKLAAAFRAAALSIVIAGVGGKAAALGLAPAAPPGYELPYGANPFAPSNARTADGGFLRQGDFIPAARCVSCHSSTHAEWSESAHRSSFREPFYQVNVKHLTADRGIAVTRHCEGCHNPVALLSGALSANARMARPYDDEGVTCSVCHSIESADTRGIGSYVMARPALLVRADGARLRAATDAQVLADLDGHRRAVMRPLLRSAELCATCHKAAVLPEHNGRKWLRSFAIYDEWQQSAFSNEAVQPLGVRERHACQSCHMPKNESGYAGHRWPGGNTAIPAHYGHPEQIAATSRLLRSGVVTVDLFALRPVPRASAAAAGTAAALPEPLKTGGAQAVLAPGGEAEVDVVVANQGVGHSFPAELRDIFEAWLELEVTDGAGKTIYHSGAVRPDGTLELSAHAYRAVPIDDQGEPVIRHDIWRTRVTALDRSIPAGRADLARFRFRVPADARAPLTVTAKLNYRRFNRRFSDWVESQAAPGTPRAALPTPVVEMAVDQVQVELAAPRYLAGAGGTAAGDGSSGRSVASSSGDLWLRGSGNAGSAAGDAALRKRWRAYGVALFDQQQLEAAYAAFDRALGLATPGSPDEAASQTDLAMTLLRSERAGDPEPVLERAEMALSRALATVAGAPRALFYRALLSLKRFRYSEAQNDLEALSRARPRDRHVWLQLAGLYLLERRDREAQAAYERVLAIDPDDNEAHAKLAGLFWRFGLADQARREQDAFQARHTDTVAETLRRGYLRAHPELYSTWAWREFGDNPIGSAP